MRVTHGLMPHLLLTGVALLGLASSDDGLTTKHEKGRCAIRGQCGSESILYGDLPCADNSLAEDPEDDVRKKLVEVCGEKWASGPICCMEDQIDVLNSNLNTVDNFIASCPACRSNFFNLFCTFTCSPDQSLFVNVTETSSADDGKFRATKLDNLWTEAYSTVFYDSCKDVKFGPTNTRALDLIAAGAEDGRQFLDKLGQKRLGGSPFDMSFPLPEKGAFPGMEPATETAHPCNSSNPNYRCTCQDCESNCAELAPVREDQYCHVGSWACLSFAIVIVYAALIVILVLVITGHVAYRVHARNRSERLRLLQDTELSDDEDEDGEIVYQPGVLSRPVRKYYLNGLCDAVFSRLGRTCARFPATTISTTLVLVILLSLGWLRFAVEKDPVRLWVAPDSAAAEEKAFFDASFGRFFRAEQVFLVNSTQEGESSPVLSYETLEWWSSVEERVRHVTAHNGQVTFEDVCYKPTGDACVVQSVLRYWDQKERIDEKGWREYLQGCIDDPTTCRPEFQQPIEPKVIFGGYNKSPLDAKAMVITWVVENHDEGTKKLKKAEDWEKSLLSVLKEAQIEAEDRGLRLSFNTERSLEEELNQSANTDAKIVVISYVIMFLYASLALGSTTLTARQMIRNPTSALVQSKFMLGIIGIVIVLFSVSASVGLFSAAGVKVTLIIAEVIPFLVLAVGVDNIFLIVHEFERINSTHSEELVEERMARALGRMGPSILLSATMETVTFALGAFVGMPAVRNFAAYAAGAVLINAFLQITMFVSTLALNQRRVEANRIDCFPCVRAKRSPSVYDGHSQLAMPEEDGLQRFIRTSYAPALLGKKTKVAILSIFIGVLTAGIALLPKVELGLDQRIAIPTGSYLIDYFNDVSEYLDIGPPVYFVTRELNVTKREHQLELCGRFTTCRQNSLTNIIEGERKRPEDSYITDTAASWVDDYFLWLDPGLKCCVDPKTQRPCFEGREPPYNRTLFGMPQGDEYMTYLRHWLSESPDDNCPLAGKAAYSNALVLPNDNTNTILASHFRTSHTPLRTQSDFISAYAAARRIAGEIEALNPGVSVFPYSNFYVFFDPYASIVRLTLSLLGAGIAVCFAVSALLLGSIRTALVVAATVAMTLVDIGGAMALAGVSLNPITLVNLVICVGIAVEFCAHIARAFTYPSSRLLDRSSLAAVAAPRPLHRARRPPSATVGLADAASAKVAALRGRDARAWAALTQVGASVFSGITVTKLLGVCVLAFTRSKIFEIYYFRVWLALVVFAALHALVFLPVALSLCGGSGYIDPVADGSLEEDLARRRGVGRGSGRALLSGYRDVDDDDDDDDDDNDGYDSDEH